MRSSIKVPVSRQAAQGMEQRGYGGAQAMALEYY
jgi:hypothetical protein